MVSFKIWLILLGFSECNIKQNNVQLTFVASILWPLTPKILKHRKKTIFFSQNSYKIIQNKCVKWTIIEPIVHWLYYTQFWTIVNHWIGSKPIIEADTKIDIFRLTLPHWQFAALGAGPTKHTPLIYTNVRENNICRKVL